MDNPDIIIEEMTADSWYEVVNIYTSGIASRNATFEEHTPDWNVWDTLHRKECRFVARKGEKVVGWAAISNISDRIVYAGVAEVSIYVDPEYQGRGIGDKLMKSLITESETIDIWTLQAGIFPENESSMKLHLRNGFRVVGTREKIGKMDGRWRDVVLLERRSTVVGIE